MSQPEAAVVQAATVTVDARRSWLQALSGARVGMWVYAATPCLWIVQAGLLAWAVQRLADGADWQSLLSLGLAYVLLGALRATGEAWASRQLFKAARTCVSQARAQASAALASHSPLDRTRAASGHAASVLAEQAETLLPWLLRYQPARWRVMLVPPVIAIFVGSQSWMAALILLGAAPMIPLAMAFVGWRARAASEEHLQALGGMNGFLLDRLRGLSTLRALGAVDLTAQRLRASAETLRERTMRVLRIAFLSSAALELFSALAVALVAVYVGFHLLGQIAPGSWGDKLSLGEGLFVLLLAPAFFEPLRELSAVWHDKAAGQAAQEALDALQSSALALPGAGENGQARCVPSTARTTASAPAALTLRQVSLVHANEAPLFDGLNLHIAAGEHVALVGASGSGKSSLLALMAGLLPATHGEVWVGEERLTDANATALRQRMAWIGQKPHVFAGTVQANVALGRPAVSLAQVQVALQHAGLGAVAHLGAHSPLGEGGLGLSGGEALRLALARAVATPQADVWLLDEPTAHLDRATADSVMDALLALAQGRTLIVATHDPALAARVGRVIQVQALRADAAQGGSECAE